MDDEEHSGSLFGRGYWAYQRGRSDAESEHDLMRWFARMRGDAPVSRREYDRVVQVATEWKAECARLQALNAQLAAQVAATRDDYAHLKAWADAYVAKCDEWKRHYDALSAVHDADVAWRFEKEFQRALGRG